MALDGFGASCQGAPRQKGAQPRLANSRFRRRMGLAVSAMLRDLLGDVAQEWGAGLARALGIYYQDASAGRSPGRV